MCGRFWVLADNDAVVNSTLERLQRGGARITEIVLRMASTGGPAVATYLIVYEAQSPMP